MAVKIPHQSMSELAALVHYHRKRSGLSRVDLAILAGTGKTVIYDLEHGKASIQWNSIQKILHALNISLWADSPLMEEYEEKGQGL
jgi:HTH-type transcriptional regulator/antitoxin HipB